MKLVNTREAADMLRISERMIGKLVQEGQLPPRRIGRAVRSKSRTWSALSDSMRTPRTSRQNGRRRPLLMRRASVPL